MIFFVLFSSSALSVSIHIVNEHNPDIISQDIIKKTTNSNADIAEDDTEYYIHMYKVENIPINWDQYLRKPNSSIPILAGILNVSVELPFTFPFYGHPVKRSSSSLLSKKTLTV